MSYDQRPLESPGYDDKHAIQHNEDGTPPNGSFKDVPTAAEIHRMGPEERALALRAAQQIDPGLNAFDKRSIIFFWIVMCVCMCSGDNGFDGTVMSSINSIVQYQTYFNIDPKTSGSKTGIVFGIYTVGQVCSFFPASYLPDRIGRRWSMFVGNTCLIIGALLTANAQNLGMFIAGRFLTGLGCSTGSTSAKSYLAEITSPSNRGRWMGLLNSFYYVGQITASGIAIPFGRTDSEYAWRAPIYIQIVPAFLNVAFVLLLPESPRWLYTRGRKDEAIRILAKYHSKTNDINSPLIALEIQEIEENISLSGADRRFWDFRALFRTAANRYRFGLCAIVSCWGQLSGNGLITYFLPTLLLQAGIVDADRQRVLNFVNSVTSFIGALTGTLLTDKVGRRKLMLFASFCCMAGMAIVAGLLSDAGVQSDVRANAGICFIFLFMVFFSVGWTPIQALYPAEVLSYENRAKGLALQGIVTNSVSLINTFGLPSALIALTWKTYLIFMAWDVVGIVTIWLYVVETKQLSLEDMDAVFNSANPKQTSFDLARQARERRKREKEEQAQIHA